ncbi:MAG: serine/threonine protein kinase [Gemmataceae bacterium]
MAIQSIAAFIDALRRSRLLDAEQLSEVGRVREWFTEPTGLAWHLLDRSWLTVYQINHLLQEHETDLVLGDYVLEERLGQGGIGEVYRATRRGDYVPVALKVIHADHLTRPEAVRQFEWEMRVLSQLDHPNVVRILGADQANGRHYFAMEYVEGTHLGRLIQQVGPLPIDLASHACRQAALGLQHAHEHGLIHRDIKPANLLVMLPNERLTASTWDTMPGTGRWLVKILDWGLAALRIHDGSAPPSTGVTLGTADYLAPEQAQDPRNADIRADIYSLGCTLYHLLTGQVPFPDGSVMQKLLQHQKSEPIPVQTLRTDVPGALAAILKKMMAKNPDERWATPAALAEALEPWCQSRARAPETILSLELPGNGTATARERRTSFRHRCQVDANCTPVNVDIGVDWPASILDISRGGIGLLLERRFEMGTLLDVELFTTTPHESRTLVVRVVNLRRQKEGHWIVGCAFARELTDQELWAFRAERVRAPSPDLRAWLRIPCSFEEKSTAVLALEKLPTRIINISPGGVALLVDRLIDAGTLLRLELQGAPEFPPLMVLSYVIHVTSQSGGQWALGCAFATELNDDELRGLV